MIISSCTIGFNSSLKWLTGGLGFRYCISLKDSESGDFFLRFEVNLSMALNFAILDKCLGGDGTRERT